MEKVTYFVARYILYDQPLQPNECGYMVFDVRSLYCRAPICLFRKPRMAINKMKMGITVLTEVTKNSVGL